MKSFLILFFLLVFAGSNAAQTQNPNFAALAMDGSKIDTAELKGKIVVLNLWFINCPNCRAEIKLLNEVVDYYKGNKDVVFVALAASKKADLEKFLEKNPFKYQVVPSADAIILSKFGTPDKSGQLSLAFPMHYVLDRSGTIVMKMQGTKGVDAVKAELRKLFVR